MPLGGEDNAAVPLVVQEAVMETLRLKNDSPARKRLFVAGAMAHPAKGHIALWQEMIERYTKPGDWVLDPMAGIGTSLVAALMGRNVVCVELEPHFVEPMQASWVKMQQHPMLGHTMGQAVILRGDARHLPLCSADAILSSPPYEATDITRPLDGTTQGNATHKAGLQRRYTRPQVDAVVSSPPYEASEVAQSSDGEANRRFRAGVYEGDALKGMGLSKGYTRPAAIPPAISLSSVSVATTEQRPIRENVGNLRGQAYWDSMSEIYRECYRVLRPGGILALVLKGFTRDGKYVDLPGQTEALLLAAGWQKHDHWRRELWSLSFWRILQKRRDPAAFDDRLNYEEVVCFRKPEGAGNGVAAVLSSPPYEGIVGDNKEGPGQTSVPGGWKAGTVNKHRGYTQPAAIITSPPYEGSLQGDEPTGKLFETERRVNSPASGNRKSLRKPLGQGYSKLQARAERVAKTLKPGERNVFQEAIDNPKAVSRRGYEYDYTHKTEDTP